MSAIWHKQEAVAVVQLEQAISLFLDEKDYYSAATLAAASEEISGKIVMRHGRPLGKNDALKELMLKFSKNQILSLLEDKDGKCEEIAIEWVLYKYAHWLRHYNKESESVYINSEVAAYELIERALTNITNCGQKIKNAERFRKYAPPRYAGGKS